MGLRAGKQANGRQGKLWRQLSGWTQLLTHVSIPSNTAQDAAPRLAQAIAVVG